MLFNTVQFGIFLAVVLALYFSLGHRWQNYMLLVASAFFYACWDWRFLSLIFISTTVDFVVGNLLDGTENDRHRKHILAWSVVFNLGFLGFFKYYGFFAESLQSLFGAFGCHPSLGTLHVVLPVGISFYTFQSMSYTIDIYRRELKPASHYLDFALCVAFFPHMVAGPIQRAQSLIDQVTHPRKVTLDNITEGFYLIVWGLFKKMVMADNLAVITERVFAQSTYTFTDVFTGVLAFAFQIYGDFSGYSDIARGVARLMGFNLMVNFNLPYFALNPQDHWRRWHISLSTWLRDYLYFSLGGSRNGEVRTCVNLMITMVLGGLWHGAAWTYVLWGTYQGVLLVGHRMVQRYLPEVVPQTPLQEFAWRVVRIAMMFSCTLYGYLIFRAKNFHQLAAMTSALFSVHVDRSIVWLVTKIAFYCALPFVLELWQLRKKSLNALRESPVLIQAAFYLACFYLILIFGAFDAQSFIYFQF